MFDLLNPLSSHHTLEGLHHLVLEVLSVAHVFQAESVRTVGISIRIQLKILEHSTTQIVENLSNMSDWIPIGKVNSD